jgi:thioredoxin reductase
LPILDAVPNHGNNGSKAVAQAEELGMTSEISRKYEVVVVGGGAAGLSAAVTLSRALRSTLVVDAGEPRNAPAAGVHGFLSRDGVSPGELLAEGRKEVRRYGGTVTSGEVIAARTSADGFDVVLRDGRTVAARRLLIATGLSDELPQVEGLKDRWGRDVLHCPYCHGWEVRHRAIGVLASGPMAVHQALLFRQWSANITLFLNDAVEPSEEEWEQLSARSISVVMGRVLALEVTDDAVTGVALSSGKVLPVEAVVVGPRFEARSALLESLGVETVEHPLGIGKRVETNAQGATSVAGVWAAGNVSDLTAQVIASAAAGVAAGAAINADLISEETRRAVSAAVGPFTAEIEARVSEKILGNRRHGFDAAFTGRIEGREAG